MHNARMPITPKTVKDARERLGETQATFAERFGVNQATVHRWETDGPPERGAAGKAIELVLAELQGARA